MRPIVWRMASGLLVLVAFAFFWLAFTQFDAAPPQPGSPGFSAYEWGMVRDARLSVAFGLAGCFTLLGAFACLNAARRRAAAPTATDGP